MKFSPGMKSLGSIAIDFDNPSPVFVIVIVVSRTLRPR
jgi:hypothetical protein